jgi:hypothetical protein
MDSEPDSRRRRLEEIIVETLKDVDPDHLGRIKREFIAEIRRRKFRVVKGGRYESQPGTLKGESTL